MARSPGPRKTDAEGASDGKQIDALPTLTPQQQELVRQHMGLVGVHLKTRVPTPWQPNRLREYEDLFQEGCMALARAAARYRPERHGVFAAYALPRIRSAVYKAIFEQFTVVRVPTRTLQHLREQIADPRQRPPHHVQEFAGSMEKTMVTEGDNMAETDSIRHVLRRRYEIAVRRALEQMRAKRWPVRDPSPIMQRIARERLLIDGEQERTPLRRIAREAGVSSGRANDYERHLVQAIQHILEADPQVQSLNRMAHEDSAGLDAPLDAARRERLRQDEVVAFLERFDAMEVSDRALAIYSMIEKSAQSLPEVARNLFCLSMRTEALAELPAA
jgi:RNA polymerase sigma factor (sigma-70 family)